MNPFSTYLLDLRWRYQLSQQELANVVGYEQGYISGIEVGKKNPPNEEFITKLIIGLDLDASEQSALRQAVAASQRKYLLPGDAPAEVFHLVTLLWQEMGNLQPAQIKVIMEVLRMRDQWGNANGSSAGRIARKNQREEAHM
jgi:transcriptional regulator with XRE-family HTH domain